MPSETLKRCTEAVYAARRGGTTHLEWLEVPSKRHGPTTLADTLEKIRFLKDLGVHQWPLDAISLPKLRAYAQKAQGKDLDFGASRTIKPSNYSVSGAT